MTAQGLADLSFVLTLVDLLHFKYLGYLRWFGCGLELDSFLDHFSCFSARRDIKEGGRRSTV